MNIIDIAKIVQWKNVKRAIKYYYPKDRNDYEKLLEQLASMKKVKVKPGELLAIYGGTDLDLPWYQDKLPDGRTYGKKFLDDFKKGEEWQMFDVIIRKPDSGEHWSVSFVKWAYLANLPIEKTTLMYLAFEDIIAHFIWEITFYGSEEDMMKEAKEMEKRVKEIKKSFPKK